MKINFRILDLFVVTTCVASLAGAFQTDLILFRQLLCLFIVALFSSAAVALFSHTNRKPRFLGSLGGVIGGLVYIVLAILFSNQFFGAEPFLNPGPFPRWMWECVPALVLSVLFGATIGPLIALRFRNCQIPDEFKRSFWFSVVLFTGIFLLGVFAMFDRRNMQSRDWLAVGLVLTFVFVIHTNQWLTRFQAEGLDSGSQQPGHG